MSPWSTGWTDWGSLWRPLETRSCPVSGLVMVDTTEAILGE